MWWKSLVFLVFVPIIDATWIARKPPFAHTLLLLENFENAPEARARGDTHHGLQENVFDDERGSSEYEASDEKHPPHFHAKVVFAFDNERVKHANAQKCANTNHKPQKVVAIEKFHHK